MCRHCRQHCSTAYICVDTVDSAIHCIVSTHMYIRTYIYIWIYIYIWSTCCIVLLCHIGRVTPGLTSCCIKHIGTLSSGRTLPMWHNHWYVSTPLVLALLCVCFGDSFGRSHSCVGLCCGISFGRSLAWQDRLCVSRSCLQVYVVFLFAGVCCVLDIAHTAHTHTWCTPTHSTCRVCRSMLCLSLGVSSDVSRLFLYVFVWR